MFHGKQAVRPRNMNLAFQESSAIMLFSETEVVLSLLLNKNIGVNEMMVNYFDLKCGILPMV